MTVGLIAFTEEHLRIMREDEDRRYAELLAKGLELRPLCDQVLTAKTLQEAETAEAALMHGEEGLVCACAVARRVLVAIAAERRQARTKALRDVIAAVAFESGDPDWGDGAARSLTLVRQWLTRELEALADG